MTHDAAFVADVPCPTDVVLQADAAQGVLGSRRTKKKDRSQPRPLTLYPLYSQSYVGTHPPAAPNERRTKKKDRSKPRPLTLYPLYSEFYCVVCVSVLKHISFTSP